MPLHLAQSKIVQDNHRFRILVCGRKFGKTTLASEEIMGCAIAGKDRRILYISPTLDDSRRLMWDRLKNKLGSAIFKSNDSRLELIVKTQDNGKSRIFLGSWEKVQDYRGDEYDLIIPDEAQDYRNFWLGWHEALRPTLTPRQGQALFMGTPKGFNHFYDLYNFQDIDNDYKSFHFTSYDNPFLPNSEIEKAKQELNEDRFAQEYLADFRKTQGLVYKIFDRQKHTYDRLEIKPTETIAGIDFGFTNPCAVLTIQRDGDNNFYVEEEWYKTGKTDSQIAEYVASKNFNKVYPDPESPSAIKELEKKKINVRDVIKNKDSVKNGITKVTELFKANRLKINKNCINLIFELETYSYPDKQDFKNEYENPIKEDDHAVDALRYALMMQSDNKREAFQFIPSQMNRNPNYIIEHKYAKQYIPR